MDDPTSERHRAAPRAIAGVVGLVAGVVALLAAIVGYSLTNGNQSAGDRLADAHAFGLPAGVVGAVGLVLLLVGLVLLGIGIGSARHHDGAGPAHPVP